MNRIATIQVMIVRAVPEMPSVSRLVERKPMIAAMITARIV